MKFGILVFPQVEELDFAGPWEMATMWPQVAHGPDCLVVAQHAAPVVCAKGLSVNPHVAFADCPPLDVLLVPGGQVVEQRFVQDGPVWTAAGVSAGIDLTLADIAHVAGADAAGKVQFAAEYHQADTRCGDSTRHPQAPGYIRPA